MFRAILSKDIIKFLFLVLVTIIVTYRAPVIIASLWYLLTLILYYRSKDEALWLTFFLVTVDGFFGYFGVYSVTLQVLPNLPPIELAQFYILFSFIKALSLKSNPYIFYSKYITVLLLYLFLLMIWGQMLGFSGELKDYFRVIKLTLPFLLFYSLPRLFVEIASYKRLFTFLFIILIGAFATQLFTLLTGYQPSVMSELNAEQLAEAGSYRGFYNVGVTLLGLFGALYFLSIKKRTSFNNIYLFTIIISAFGMAYLSATRGWIIGFSIIIVLTLVLTFSSDLPKLAGLLSITALIIIAGLSNDKIKEQVNYASRRLETLGSIAEGDVTAGGTLSRIDVHGPTVMKAFRESPIFGWGFSNVSREYADSHVGNQTILLYSGIVGFVLLIGFFLYFSYKLLILYFSRRKQMPSSVSLLVFVIFIIGWFIIHSTSGQHFNYWGIPAQIMPQAIFFSFGALMYTKYNYTIHG